MPDATPPPRSLGDAPTVAPPASVGDALTATGADPAADETRVFVATAPPGFVLEGELGRGGMGVVYKARQLGLNRPVALKMILGERIEQKHLIRFLAEAEAVASVKHPNVVEVFQFGEDYGRPYLAMEFCPGGALASGKVEPNVAAESIAAVADGVAAAHALGIVHRDLKPGNVLLAADGTPKVTDFGLAKRVAGSSELTKTNAVMGTPAYMAPEQAQGGTKFVGPQADVWSLGVMLYEALCGERPFGGDDTWQVLAAVMKADVAPLRKKVPGVPRDLELICLKCLEKEPADRYPSAAELAADLRRFLAGEPVSVRAVGTVERALKWAKRKPTLAAAYGLTVFSVIAVGLVAGAVWLWQRAEGARAQLDGEKRTAERARDDADTARAGEANARHALEIEQAKLAKIEYARTVQIAHRLWQERSHAAALTALNETRPTLRGWEWEYLRYLCQPEYRVLRHPEGARLAVWSPDGARILTADEGKAVRVWDAAGAHLGDLSHTGFLVAAAWSPDGVRVATVEMGRSPTDPMTARVWHVADRKVEARFPIPGENVLPRGNQSPSEGRVLAWNAAGTVLLTAGGRTAHLRDPATGRELGSLPHPGPVTSGAWSADGTRVLTTCVVNPNIVPPELATRVWDAATAGEVAAPSHPGSRAAAWSPDGKSVVTLGASGPARLWDAGTWKDRPLGGSFAGFGRAVWAPDGTRFAAVDWLSVTVVDAATGKTLATLKGHTGAITTASWNPQGTMILTASEYPDSTARVWDPATGKVLAAFTHAGGVLSAAWHPDGMRVLTTSQLTQQKPAANGGVQTESRHDPAVRVWDAAAKEATVLSRVDGVAVAEWNPHGTRVLLGGRGPTVSVVDPDTGAVEAACTRSEKGFGSSAAVWSRDGLRILAADMGAVRVWDAKTGREVNKHLIAPRAYSATASQDMLAAALENPDNLLPACWSPDESRFVTVAGAAARVRDGKTGADRATIKHPGTIRAAAWHPSGTKLLTAGAALVAVDAGGRAATVPPAWVWDADTGKRLVGFKHHASVAVVAWSPDGTKVLTAGRPFGPEPAGGPDARVPAVQVWDANTGQPLVAFDHPGEVRGAVWSADGATVLTRGDQAPRLWDVASGRERAVLKGHTGDIYAAEFHPLGTRVATAGSDGTTRLWDCETGAEVLTLRGHTDGVWVVRFSPDGSRLLTGGTGPDRTARVWDSRPAHRGFLPRPK